MTWIAAPSVAYRVGLPAARRVALSELDGEHVVARVRLDFRNPAFERPAAAVEAAVVLTSFSIWAKKTWKPSHVMHALTVA